MKFCSFSKLTFTFLSPSKLQSMSDMRLLLVSDKRASARLTKLAFLLLWPTQATAQPPPTSLSPFSSPDYSPLAATVIVVLIVVLFIVTAFISTYLNHFGSVFFGINTSTAILRGRGWARAATAARGLDPAVIETFPSFLYSDVKTHRLGKGALECSVCLNEFVDPDILRLLPVCNHVFHSDCVDPWLTCRATCPVCRANLEPKKSQFTNSFQFQHSENDSETSDGFRPNPGDHDLVVNVRQTPEIRSPSLETTHRNHTRIAAMKEQTTGKIPMSNSTVELLGEDFERFTLRLPEAVRSKLVTVGLYRAGSEEPELSTVRNPRTGFRTRSEGGSSTGNERFQPVNKLDRWRFSMTPPITPRSGLTRSPSSDGETEDSKVVTASKNLFRPMRSPFDWGLRSPSEDAGKRSSDRLWLDHPV
ncbi:hypothetical protein Nepgr_002035 [Nepenthes gracilis]|uniref:RING-type E3 ubiquitin transferase n=1 Tax=Nepenthes gracilis TaxID=150966 RepID=A0AAD3P656_NEPGR|nr:hypothetical protein Nepgr_002035 [Nepenthes gracilis]